MPGERGENAVRDLFREVGVLHHSPGGGVDQAEVTAHEDPQGAVGSGEDIVL